ncbi:Methyl-accepting chemotaxis protein [Malonomonas rubra DSM 5091]|uniref:Methyl-accepting chemotaxis protein n=1 Tax=Malonomonas rubra DSM 5091 TaxID=1122189 RepID=A0A1M6HCR5_MALRU|nr:methyl-accepting chemotaxis protein [Malonomonas rubra]SHJ19982.1 Methyl-accepting chemotaxis protein [Malonomonas rubra DSM 5091]
MRLFGKIFLPIFISLLIVSLIIGYTTYQKTDQLVESGITREIALRKESHSDLAKEKLSKIVQSSAISAKLHKEQAAVISSLDFVKRAYSAAGQGNINNENDEQVTQARNYLKDNFQQIEDSFIRLTGSPDMRAHFHLSNSRSFARVWRNGWQVKRNNQKLDISDDLSSFREMVVEINKSGKPLAGLELGIGGFVIRGIVPITDLEGEAAGSIEIYSSYGKLVQGIELASDMSISLIMPAEKLKIAKRLNDQAKYPVIDNSWVQVCSSENDILPQVYRSDQFASAYRQPDYQFETENHSVYTKQVVDFSGKPIGMLVLTEDLRNWNAQIAATRKAGDDQSNAALITTILLLAAAILTLGTIGYFLARRISNATQSAVDMLDQMEAGNLDVRLESAGKDEIAELNRSLNKFADNLRDEVLAAFEKLAAGDLTFEAHGVIREPLQRANQSLSEVMARIQQNGVQIASSSSEVADSSQSLAQGATEQASSLEEISASLDEMSSQTSLNADNANQARTLAAQASQSAASGNQQMENMVSAMAEINTAGENISKIIKVIDEIAFQTNLLALNAAVEAARAGQHGKGFAVVAEEVRNLAARSAKAAQETADLIEGSVEKTANGTAIAHQTAESLQEIVDGISKVSDLVAEISAASNEQAQGISQINQGISQLDNVTQQNTATAETSASVAEELSAQAAQMRQMLQRFTLKQGGAMPMISPAAAPVPPQEPSAESHGWAQLSAPRQDPNSVKIALDDSDFGKY